MAGGSGAARWPNVCNTHAQWGAVILSSSFLNYMINGGVFCTNGLMLPQFLREFGAGEVTTTWLASLQVGLCMCSGIISGVMVELYGCRLVAITGGAVAAIGYITSAFATNIGTMFLTYSVLPGFGLGLQFVPCLVVVQYYFDEKRTMAAGITAAGSSTGVFLYAMLCQYLLHNYGYRGTLLLNGAVVFHSVPLGALMTLHPKTQWRPSMGPMQNYNKTTDTLVPEDSVAEGTEKNPVTNGVLTNGTSGSIHSVPNGMTSSGCNGIKPTIRNGHIAALPESKSTQPHQEDSNCKREPNSNVGNGVLRKSHLKIIAENLLNRDKDSSQSLPHLTQESLYIKPMNGCVSLKQNGYPHQKSRSHYDMVIGNSPQQLSPLDTTSQETVDIPKEPMTSRDKLDLQMAVLLKDPSHKPPLPCSESLLDLPPDEPQPVKTSLLVELGHTLKGVVMGFGELKRAPCLLTFLSNFCGCFGYQIPYLFLPTKSLLLGYEHWTGAFLISVIGVSDTFGRLFFGWLGNCMPKHVPILFSVGMLLCGIGTMGAGFVTSFEALVMFAVAHGTGTGGYVALNPQNVVEILGFSKVARFIGLMAVATGLAFLMSPPISAFLFELSGSINVPFYTGGSCQILGAMILLIYRATPHYEKRPGAFPEDFTTNMDELPGPPLSCNQSYRGSIASRFGSNTDFTFHGSNRSRLNHAGITLVPMYGSAISVNTLRSAN